MPDIRLSLTDDLLAAIDEERGKVPRVVWIRDALSDRLSVPAPPPPPIDTAALVERGRKLASERDDLIARGADPADLVIPLAPLTPEAPASTTRGYSSSARKVSDLAPPPRGPAPGSACSTFKARSGTARCFNCGQSRSAHF